MNKPTPGELRDVDVRMVSLVKRGANGRQFKIFKAADEPAGDAGAAAPEDREEVRGLFRVLKQFFTGSVQKQKAAQPIPTFSELIAAAEFDDTSWRAFSTLREAVRGILASDAEDKAARVGAAIDQFKSYFLGLLSRVGIQKALAGLEAVEVQKVGRKISAARLKALMEARAILDQIISEASEEAGREGEVGVTKEELQKALSEAVAEATKPIEERLAKLEKAVAEDGSPDGGAADGKRQASGELAELIKQALDEALKPIEQRLSVVEKARGISNRVEEEVKKSQDGFWGGVFS